MVHPAMLIFLCHAVYQVTIRYFYYSVGLTARWELVPESIVRSCNWIYDMEAVRQQRLEKALGGQA